MNFIAKIQNTFDNWFVTKDGLYEQAVDLIENWDNDGDGVISTEELKQSTSHLPPDDINRIAAAGFADADESRNGNGYATAKDVRAVLERFDNRGNENKTLDGFELLALIDHYKKVSVGYPPVTGGGSGAMSGARAVAA